MAEKRRYQRKKHLHPVDYSAGGRPFQRTTQNISAGGMFILTRDHLTVGAEMTACFEVSGERLKKKAVVVRRNSQGLGVAFLHESFDEEQALKGLISKF